MIPKEIEYAAANLADPNICKTDNWIAGAMWASNNKIQFAIECLESLNNEFNKEVIKNKDSAYLSGMKTLLLTNKINELKQQIQ